MVGMGYQQINADHTVFFLQHGGHITIIAGYINDMIVTGNNKKEIAQLKVRLDKEIEVKDIGLLRYFLVI